MIPNAIFALANTSPDLIELIQRRFTPGLIPQDQPVPCAYYGTDQIKLIPVRNPMGCYSGKLEIGFQVQEGDYYLLEEITQAFNKCFENFNDTIEGVSLNISTGQTTPDDFDPELRYHTRAIEYTITAQI